MRFFALLLFFVPTFALPAPRPEIAAHALSTACGETLHVSESARIEHHLGGNYGESEACPWIVRVDGAESLRFDLESSEVIDTTAKVTVATVAPMEDYGLSTVLYSQEMNIAAGPTEVTLRGSIAVITFTSDYYLGRGWALNVTRVGTSDVILSPDSVDQIRSGSSGNLTHPAAASQYSNNELSTFLIAPADYNSTCTSIGCTTLSYTEIALEHYCYDRVDVFSFSPYYQNGWIHSRVICGGEPNATFPYLSQMALVTFASDSSETDAGFSIQYQNAGLRELLDTNPSQSH